MRSRERFPMRRDIPLLLAALIATNAGCNRKPAPPAGAAAPPATPIRVVKPEMRPVKRVVEQPGTILAFEETALCANLSGYVDAVAEDPNKLTHPPHDRFIDIDSRV